MMIGSIRGSQPQAFQESMREFHSYYPGIRIWVIALEPWGKASEIDYISSLLPVIAT